MVSEKEDYSSVRVFKESWLEFDWKSMATIESSNKSSYTKKPTGIRKYKHWRTEEITEKTCSNLIKNFGKWLQQVIKNKRPCYWISILR